MTLKISRRGFVRVISFSAAILLTLSVYAVSSCMTAKRYKSDLQNDYSAALSELTECLSAINLNLQKQIYASTPTQFSMLSSKLSKQAGDAKSAVSRLPLPSSGSSGIYRFLSQVGEYSLSLASKAAAGGTLTEEERLNLNKLSQYANSLSGKVDTLNAALDGSAMWDGEIEYALSGLDDENTSQIAAAAEDIAQTVTNYPTLIYDGPFSDHIDRKTPAYTADKLTVSRDAAKTIAAKYLDCESGDLIYSGDENSVTAAYTFKCDDRVCAVTKEGGALLYISSGRQTENAKFNEQDAVKTASKYLSQKLGLEFRESYYMIENGVCTINFACVQNGIVCYSDLIKVGVALDSGRIEDVEARGFIMNHHARKTQDAKYTADRAKSVVSNKLAVKSAMLCLIDMNGTDEKLCYEFTCSGTNGDDVLVYINANTLKEENILILQHMDGGALTR